MTKKRWFVYLSVFEDLYDLVISDLLSKEVSKPVGLLYSKGQQKRVNPENYKDLLFFSDIFEKSKNYEPDVDYLSYLEDKYSISSLSLIIFSDRHIGYDHKISYRQKLALLELTFKFANELIEKYKFEFAWFESISGLLSYVLYTVFKFEGVKICAIESGRFPDKLAVTDNKNLLWDGVEQEIGIVEKDGAKSWEVEEAKEFLEQYRTNLPVPTKYEKKYLPRIRLSDFRKLKRWIHDYFKDSNSILIKSPFELIFLKIRRILRGYLANKIFDNFVFDPKEKYVFFPLHFQPEATTLVCAPYSLNQVSVIEDISKSLPVGYKLIVKEHHDSIGRRRIADYKDIRSLWNVVLVGPKENSLNIIKKSKCIITITSTVGLQALLLKIPVITLARVSYDASPSIIRGEHVAKQNYNSLIKQAIGHTVSEKDVINFCVAVQRKLSPQNNLILNHPMYADQILHQNNIVKISDVIYKAIQSI